MARQLKSNINELYDGKSLSYPIVTEGFNLRSRKVEGVLDPVQARKVQWLVGRKYNRIFILW